TPRFRFMAVILVLQASSALAFDQGAGQAVNRSDLPDSFKYYGPGGLWKLWDRNDWQPQRLGRDTWIFWTWGNQKFLRLGAKGLSNQPVPISLDLYRVLDSRIRDSRFTQLGLINEPNCRKAPQPDEFGLWVDVWEGDPAHYYPGDARYDQQ